MARTKGSKNRRTAETVQIYDNLAQRHGVEAMEYLFTVLKNKRAGIDRRITAARELMPYRYDKRATQQIEQAQQDLPLEWAAEPTGESADVQRKLN